MCSLQGEHYANMDQIYVAYLRQYCVLAEPKAVFTFCHPNFANASNERSANVEFVMDRPADLMGFAGYFHMNLYKDVTLSIVPSTYSEGMISWFPALIPLRELYRVQPGDTVALNIERKVDDCGVWYEWLLHHTVTVFFFFEHVSAVRPKWLLHIPTSEAPCIIEITQGKCVRQGRSNRPARQAARTVRCAGNPSI
ncbi:hypothetical protein Y032_0033g2711 [Ancylostoma ceylanicum]|nr:hypothetical protein Y032_0033g2711 [Ancylostoma ceylanicum]